MIFPQTNASTQAWYDVSAVFADVAPSVIEALRRVAWSEITAILDATLPRTFAKSRPAQGLSAAQAFACPARATTVAGTQAVGTSHGRSRRQIERQVRLLTNRSPKQLVCLTRFQFVRDSFWARPDLRLDDLALEAGYADQAHLSRHFRRYAGQTPSEFKRNCVRLKAFLSTQDVAFVQDRASGYR